MKSYEEYLATSDETVPFSNGTDFVGWQDAVCSGGRLDLAGPCANDVDEDCPLIALAFIDDRRPAEWTGPYARYDCSEYTPLPKD